MNRAGARSRDPHTPYVVAPLPGVTDLLQIHRLAPRRYPCLLESVVHGTPQARYDILAAFPRPDRSIFPPETEPFLDAFHRAWRRRAPAGAGTTETGRPPFTGGWFLYLPYELAAEIEPRLANRAIRESPRALRVPAAFIRDHDRGCVYAVCETEYAEALLARMKEDYLAAGPSRDPGIAVDRLHEEAEEIYLQRLARVKHYIREGDVFQVNLSRPWRARLREPVPAAAVYARLRRTNPAPFAGLMQLDAHTVVISSSPERLASVRQGIIRTRPIAGTYPRGAGAAEDRKLKQALVANPKERAEHIMLIDLERNDLGRICESGSVKVSELMVVESYRHVHHIVSQVEGRLRPGISPAEVIRAVFPGGTITGCPKVRCMEIIAELEQGPRGAYTGSMGYVNHDGSMDLNILIRTLSLSGSTLDLRAGSGIVADSDPRRELAETRAKAEGLLRVLRP